ncbi:MAG: ParB N-terminal domain-containing protein, partial [Pseudomonadota bacterium]
RRKLEAPSADDLSRMEEELSFVPATRTGVAPIAQVAGEAASESEVLGVETRAKLAEADAYRAAREKGLVLKEIPVDRIRDDAFVRDRAFIDRDALTELRASIVKNGVRLPIEVYALAEPTEAHDYALISGYRRLMAVREALNGTGHARFQTIKAIVRTPRDSHVHIAQMVEENEVRADLSHFERGRIAALAAQGGVFVNVEAAVKQLFPVASKAKRSKIRSFASIFEELGDLLDFPEALTERQGLQVAAALRDGAEHALRDALALHSSETAKEEWARIATVLEGLAPSPKDPSRGGRPSSQPDRSRRSVVDTPRGVQIVWEPLKSGGYALRLNGRVEEDEIASIVATIKERLG